MGNFIQSEQNFIDKINEILQTKKNAKVYIINDKLTLAVFSLLEKNLKNVSEINFIIRDTSNTPKNGELAREFEMDVNPNDLLFNQYDII